MSLNQQYHDYLQSDHWISLKSIIKVKYGWSCEYCSFHKKIQGHHLQYRSLYDCTEHDIMILCSRCHSAIHTSTSPQDFRLMDSYQRRVATLQTLQKICKYRTDKSMKKVLKSWPQKFYLKMRRQQVYIYMVYSSKTSF